MFGTENSNESIHILKDKKNAYCSNSNLYFYHGEEITSKIQDRKESRTTTTYVEKQNK